MDTLSRKPCFFNSVNLRLPACVFERFNKGNVTSDRVRTFVALGGENNR